MSFSRTVQVTIGSAAIATLILLFFFQAPFLPILTGAIGAALLIIGKSWHKSRTKGVLK